MVPLMDTGAISGFLSTEVLDRLAVHRGGGGQGETSTVEAAFVFFDITGFTPLAEALAKREGGVEELYQIISGIFGPIADTCLDAGGDVLYFAGDGVGVLFRVPDHATLSLTAQRAAHTALQAVSLVGMKTAMGLELRVRAALGCGEVRVAEVGGVNGRWILVADGEAVAQAAAADSLGAPGELTATPEAWSHLTSGFQSETVAGMHRVRLGNHPTPKVTPAIRELPDDLVGPANQYLSEALRHGLEAGTDAWLAELRLVTTVFVSLPDVRVGDDALQAALVICQQEMLRTDGAVHEVLGDKGIGFLCVFGAPPRSHGDDPGRAVEAAIRIQGSLTGIGLTSGIGVATGPVHCGIVGSARRRQYELYGASMALAARFMQATNGDGILVCERTREAARLRVSFGEAEAHELKGRAGHTLGYRPTALLQDRRTHTTAMIGRLDILADAGTRVIEGGEQNGTFLVQADAGMGKSMLFERILDDARKRGRRVLFGAADSMEERTMLYAMRSVVSDLLELSDLSGEEGRGHVTARLEADVPTLAHLAPLLNILLPLDYAETELTSQLTGGFRAENLNTLLLGLFTAASEREPILIALEDLHWMDAGAWSLAVKLVEVPRVLLLGTLRPMTSEPREFAILCEGEHRQLRSLEALGRAETARIVAQCLGVRDVSDAVLDEVFGRSEGIPFYSEEVAFALREAEALSFDNGRCDLGIEHASLQLPGTVTGVITGRIDRLAAPVQLSLKVASVLGRFFNIAMLMTVHPYTPAHAEAMDHANQLVRAALVVEAPEQPGRYFFRHALTHETTYGLLTPSQKVSLHKSAAAAIEVDFAADLTPYYARLVEHWLQAQDKAKAADYAGLAGQQALSVWANQAAIDFLDQALALDREVRGDQDIDIKWARWYRQKGDAYYSLAQNDIARGQYEQAYVMCGFPAPSFSWRTPIEVVKHIGNRYTTPAEPTPELRERCIAALQAFDNLSVICLWSGDRLGLVHVVFASDNLGVMGGPSAEASLARNMVGYSLLLAGLHTIAERDMRAAFAMAHDCNDLVAKTVTNVFLGLSMTLYGRVDEALPLLRTGWDLSREWGAGLWLHRADYMLGEALLVSARYEEAMPYFDSCAEVARAAEPHTTGFANATSVLCKLRLGASPAAFVAVLESEASGIPLVRNLRPYLMQLCVALGVAMEIYLRVGRYKDCYDLADEELGLVALGDDTYSYFRGSESHTQTALVLSALLERKMAGQLDGVDGVPDAAVLRKKLWRAVKDLKRGYKTFPAVEGRYRGCS